MITRSRLAPFLTIVLSLSFASACMKTRSQIRREAENDPVSTSPSSGSERGSMSGGTENTVQTEVTEVTADPKAIDELRSEITRLGGRLEDMERTNQDLSQQNAGKSEETKKLETRIQELEAAQIQLIESLKKKEKETPKTEPVALFEQAKIQVKNKEFGDAIESLDEYLKFPKGKHTEDAHFLRGEAYSGQKQYKKAILDYSAIQEKFPKSKHLPQALLRIGSSFESLGMKSDAKVFYQELVDRFPKSPEAKKVAAKVR